MILNNIEVTKVLSPPRFNTDIQMYCVLVEYKSWVVRKTELPFTTKEAAEKVKPGFKFLGI